MTSQLQLTSQVLVVDVDKETIDYGSRRIFLGEKGLQGWYGGAEVVRGNKKRLGAHGIFSERGWRGGALVSVSGWFETDTRAEATQAIDDLSEFIADGKEGKIIVRDIDFGGRYANCFLNNAPDIEWLPGPHERVHVKFTYDLLCTDPRHYEETPATATTGLAKPGGGLRFPLFARGDSQVLRTNLASNPIPSSAAGWTTSSPYIKTFETVFGRPAMVCTKSGSGTHLWYGRNAGTFGLSTGTPSAPGDPGTVPIQEGQTAYIALSMGTDTADMQASFVIRFFDSSGAQISYASSPRTSMPLNTWTDYDFSAVAPEGASAFYLENAIVGAVTGGERGWAGRAYLGITPGYFSGDTEPNATEAYRWTGDPGASTSEAVAPIVPTSGVLDFGDPGDAGIATITNPGNADTTVLVSVRGPAAQGFTATEIDTGRRLVYTGALGAADYVDIDSADGTVLLNGYADRGSLLTVRDWFTLDKRQTGNYTIDAAVGDPQMTITASPAWW